MRKLFTLVIFATVLATVLSSCGAPPPLRSDKYLNDTSVLTQNPCAAPCFHDITPGKTTFSEAVSKLKEDKAFTNVQTKDKPSVATWDATGGDQCCQLSANDNGLVTAVVARVAPKMTLGDVIAKYGDPQYVSGVDYSDQESVLQIVFPEKGLVTLVVPGDAKSTLSATSPVVVLLLIDPNDWKTTLDMSTLQGWAGYQSYQTYKSATPIVTPRVTATPQP